MLQCHKLAACQRKKGLLFALPTGAQEILPFPLTPSASTAGLTMQDSTYKKRVEPNYLADGAQNILIILMDDLGLGTPLTYGGEINTPPLDRVAKMGGHWDDPLQNLGWPVITNLLMDPFEGQWGDVNRQYAEHKGWVLTPMLGIAIQHLATFKEFSVRRVGLSAGVGKTLEGSQSQTPKIQQED
jgi:hypothetical protein